MRVFPGILRPTCSGPSTLDMVLRRPGPGESRYLYVPADIPEGVTRLDVEIAYDKVADSLIDIGLFDPRAGLLPRRGRVPRVERRRP